MTEAFGPEDALIVVDVQNDFCEGGAFDLQGSSAIVKPINAIARQFQTVVFTQDFHPAGHSSFASSHPGAAPLSTIDMPYGPQTLWPDHCVQGTWGAEFHPDLDQSLAHLIIRKGFRPALDSYSAFVENDRKTGTGLDGYLRARGVRRCFLCGIATDFCVGWSALDAVDHGFETVLLRNLSKEIDLEGSLAAQMAAMDAAGVVIDQRAAAA
ncbi:MAG: bifunctional nicotinamidase/pyrazinamidase [Pseudomonadota bacterium]|nr:bifunctional nicotinamidase/pyrazinamidase [Pseudomonadota bacterium]